MAPTSPLFLMLIKTKRLNLLNVIRQKKGLLLQRQSEGGRQVEKWLAKSKTINMDCHQ